ncbi:MAG: hypothetical protein EHM72_12720, partial [Calditrichaeota bacterium]
FETQYSSAVVHADSEVSLKFVFSPPSPGFYRAVFSLNDRVKKSVVLGFDPKKMTTPLTRPADFEAFWQQRKQELAQVDPEFKMIRSDRSTDQMDVYLVEMQSYGRVKIRGWYTVPTHNAPHPAILSLPGYTSTMWPSVDRTNAATLALNPRGHGNSKDDVDPQDQEFMFIGFDPENPQLYIYAGVFMDCLRAVDFLSSRPEIDASRIGVEGASQGGGLALATAALDSRVIFCAADIPWLGDWIGYLEAEFWGWNNYPKLFALHPDLTFAGINQFLSYFDTMNMAEWIRCPVLMSVGLQDDVCPPRTAFSVYNALATDKSFVVYPFTGHSVTREHEKFKDEWMAKKLGVETLGQIYPSER